MIIGAILGPLAETQLRRALAISDGDALALVSTPFTIGAYALVLGIVAVPRLMRRWERKTAVEVGVLEDFERLEHHS